MGTAKGPRRTARLGLEWYRYCYPLHTEHMYEGHTEYMKDIRSMRMQIYEKMLVETVVFRTAYSVHAAACQLCDGKFAGNSHLPASMQTDTIV